MPRTGMISGRKTVQDLVEEAKKRIVLLLILSFGLSFLMSLTSSSVWVNLPAAASVLIFCRYISLDYDVRRKNSSRSKPVPINQSSHKISVELKFPLEKSNWREKVNSTVVEEAIEQFTRHIVSEFLTDLWYSRITPDRDAPEELVQIINGVFGEISSRAREINLIDLLTRDIVSLICNHLELYRSCQAKIGQHELENLPPDSRDGPLRQALAAETKLHPALFSFKAEHKVLQHLMEGLISLTFKPEDLRCSFFRYTVRELLACAVFRPVLNLVCPRVINERIEALVLASSDKGKKESKIEEEPRIPSDPLRGQACQISGFRDSSTGVELAVLKHDNPVNDVSNRLEGPSSKLVTTKDKFPPAIGDVQLSNDGKSKDSGGSQGEWAQKLDIFAKRKTQALEPEHLENVWTKGRNYKKKDHRKQVAKQATGDVLSTSNVIRHDKVLPSKNSLQDKITESDKSERNSAALESGNHYKTGNFDVVREENGLNTSSEEDVNQEDLEPDSESAYGTDEEESSNVTGIDSPVTRVWDSKNKTKAASRIRHPLEASDIHEKKKKGRVHHPRASRPSGRKRTRLGIQKVPIWQEVERTTFRSGDGQDILNVSKSDLTEEESSDEFELGGSGTVEGGASAASSITGSSSGMDFSSRRLPENSVLADSFLKLRCEVVGASVVKSGTGIFAVYSITVTDANNNKWFIKRRYRHFEELHRRLRDFPEYHLNLPPKHIFSSGLDVPVIEERRKLLDNYLKDLLQIPAISGSIEVWDFLSVDSQTYTFSDSLSIIHSLSVSLENRSHDKSENNRSMHAIVNDKPNSNVQYLGYDRKENSTGMDTNCSISVNSGPKKRAMEQRFVLSGQNVIQHNSVRSTDKISQKDIESPGKFDIPRKAVTEVSDGRRDKSNIIENVGATFSTEWVPPNLSVPVFDLVDEIFQLHDGGWIRRQAFWVAKRILHLGMGDALDDWLIEKIQLLRKGTAIASCIKRVEQILWPDGIFITKHPNRKPPTPTSSPREGVGPQEMTKENMLSEEEQQESTRRAMFVHELIIDKAPSALVSLVGRKEYERCAEDVYYFLQSSVFMKQLAFELLELLLLAAYPELDDVVRRCHEDKDYFGVFEDSR